MVIPGGRWWRVYRRAHPPVALPNHAGSAAASVACAEALPDILSDFLEERSAEVVTLATCREYGAPALDQTGEATVDRRRRETSRYRWSQTTGVM
jgi:hypothetical protein